MSQTCFGVNAPGRFGRTWVGSVLIGRGMRGGEKELVHSSQVGGEGGWAGGGGGWGHARERRERSVCCVSAMQTCHQPKSCKFSCPPNVQLKNGGRVVCPTMQFGMCETVNATTRAHKGDRERRECPGREGRVVGEANAKRSPSAGMKVAARSSPVSCAMHCCNQNQVPSPVPKPQKCKYNSPQNACFYTLHMHKNKTWEMLGGGGTMYM